MVLVIADHSRARRRNRRNARIGPLTLAIVIWMVVNAVLAGSLAVRRDRVGPIWAIFGAILGPVALVLLQTAPPGRCRTCRTPTTGWRTVCSWCREDVRTMQPETAAALARLSTRHAPADRPLEPPAASVRRVRPPSKSKSKAAVTTSSRDESRRPSNRDDRPTLRTRLETERTSPTKSAEPLRFALQPTPPLAPEQFSPPVREPARPPPTQSSSPAKPRPAETGATNGIGPASAIYITGSTSLQPGRRYMITVAEGRFRVLGPVDDDPSTVALDLAVAGMEATAINGRLVVSAVGLGSRAGLAFMAVGGSTPDRLASAIADAALAEAEPR